MFSLDYSTPTTRELRALSLLYRNRQYENELRIQSLDDGRYEPDERLLELTAEPFVDIDDVYDRLMRIERHLRSGCDRRSVFLTVYTEMTAAVREDLNAGAFEDHDWVHAYLVEFANWYREALLEFERGRIDEVPLPWRIAFYASTGDTTLYVQDALLGINAHINYDLAYTLTEIGLSPDRESKRADHDAINAILARLVDVVVVELAAVYAADGYVRVSELLGTIDHEFVLFGMAESRRLAWQNAVLLADSDTTVISRLVQWRIRAVATGSAYFVLVPSTNRHVLDTLRHAEGGGLPNETLHAACQRWIDER